MSRPEVPYQHLNLNQHESAINIKVIPANPQYIVLEALFKIKAAIEANPIAFVPTRYTYVALHLDISSTTN